MDNSSIIDKIHEALKILLSKDSYLVENDLNERSITHKIAEHLQPLCLPFSVDCEYNGNADNKTERGKRLSFLKKNLYQLGILNRKEVNDKSVEQTIRFVYPDIIIHERGTNDSNLCIIELKKSTSKHTSEFDVIKLQAYTGDSFGNQLKYNLGCFIELQIPPAELPFKLKLFQQGKEVSSLNNK